jgi:hypothetical protein
LTRSQAAKLFDVYTDIEGLSHVTNGELPHVWPSFSGPNVWWEDSIYQEILDEAATKEGVVTHVDLLPDQIIIYIAAKWPVMRHYKLIFSNDGSCYVLYRWLPGESRFYDFTGEMAFDDAEIPKWLVGSVDGDYFYYRDREPWASTSPDAKFPWE